LGSNCDHPRLDYGNRVNDGIRCPDCKQVVRTPTSMENICFSSPPLTLEFDKELKDPKKYVFCMKLSKTVSWSKCDVGCDFPGCNKFYSKPISW